MRTSIILPQNIRWKKILLIKPNLRLRNGDIRFAYVHTPPLNLAYVASYLTDLDVEVAILDAKVKNLSYNQIGKKVKKFNPDIVGITVLVSAAVNICYNIARVVKQINPNCIVVFGGQHPTALPDETLQVDEVDIVVRGEGELTFRELITKGTPENVKGISYKFNGEIKHNPDRELIKDLGDIRYPARHLIKNAKYRLFTSRVETVETSRGCPFRCSFCTTPSFTKNLWRSRPVEKIIKELKMISQNRKITDIYFVDDNFTANTKRVEMLCERIIECKKKKEINDFKFFPHIRVDAVVKSPQMVKKMAEAGFWVVVIGIESIRKETLKDVRKGFTFTTVLKALKTLHENNIIVLGSMIIGNNLNATEEDIRNEIDFMKKVNIDMLDFKLLTPFPGIEKLEELEKNDLILTKDWSKYDYYTPMIKTKKMSPRILHNLVIFAFKKLNYFHNLRSIISKIIKTRGIFFILDPRRLIPGLGIIVKIKRGKKNFMRMKF